MASWLKAAESFLDGVDDSETKQAENLAVRRVSDQYQKRDYSHDLSHRTEDTQPDIAEPKKDLRETPYPASRLRDQLQNRKGKSTPAKLAAVSSRGVTRKKSGPPVTPEPHQSNAHPRESELQKQCEDLRKALNDSKKENSRLEDAVRSANLSAKDIGKELEALKNEMDGNNAASLRREATLQAEAVAKDLELNKINNDLTSTKKWASELEAQIVALQGTNQKLMDDRKANEGLISEALQRELAEVERLLKQERGERAENTKSTGLREENLQQELSESASALVRMQRQLEERNLRVGELEHQISDLRRKVQEATRAPQATGADVAANQLDRVEDIQEELKVAHLETEELQSHVAVADCRVQELEAEVEALQQQVLDGAVQVPFSQAEQRLKEVTELLYEKQEQYEKLSSDKASQQFAMDHKLRVLQEELDSERRKLQCQSMNQANTSGLDTVIPMDALGEAFYNLAHHKRVGKAVRTGAQVLDNTASKVVFLLRQYPLWRLGVFAYLFFIHLYCYLLITRLQKHIVLESEPALPGASRTL